MNNSSPTPTTASSPPARKITRKQLAAHCGLSVRSIDDLTRSGVLPHYKIGKSVRYDLAEVEATLRERFYVGAGTAQAHAPAPHRQTTEYHGVVLQESKTESPAEGASGGTTAAATSASATTHAQPAA